MMLASEQQYSIMARLSFMEVSSSTPGDSAPTASALPLSIPGEATPMAFALFPPEEEGPSSSE
eukprot:2432344-Prorocentrum_lima.AAC.1